ncbi:MAG: hypothetical protein JWO08_3394, partial [Verrucomicrobiaceae bacterium]|nr:hypothetical protein [Verrucomicrobiaceae bacterium]
VPPSNHASLRTPVRAGTIIICRKNSEEMVGATALVAHDMPNLFLSDLLWEIRPADGVNLNWLANNLKSDRVKKLIQNVATGTQSTMKNISQDRLLNIPIAIPPITEQRKIAAILSTWDEAIEKLETLRAANLSRRVWMRSHLFTGRIRLAGYKGEWNQIALVTLPPASNPV